MNLKLINELSVTDATDVFLKCCGCGRWARDMARARPFSSDEELSKRADHFFHEMTRLDWLEAFKAHPKIGDLKSLKEKYNATKNWAQNEQSGVEGISEDVAQNLASGNEAYLQKFGYIFIVCATGKTADEMLSMLNARLENNSETELPIAAEEQKKITHLRLEKL